MVNEFRMTTGMILPDDGGVAVPVTTTADGLNKLSTRVLAWNATGGAYAIGDLVYISGYNVANSLPQITLADADDVSTRATHVCTEIIGAGAAGEIDGEVHITGIDTSGLAGIVGSNVHLTATGTTTNTWDSPVPVGGSQVTQKVGILTVKNVVGAIYFNPQAADLQIIGTDGIANGAISADVAGRAKVAAGFFDAATALDKFGVASIDATAAANMFAADAIPDTALIADIQKDLSANKAVGSIMFDQAFVALANYDTMRWTIEGRTYEIAQTGNFVGGATVEIVIDGLGTVQAIVTALVAGIMGDAGRLVDVYDSGLLTVVVSALTTGPAGNALTLVETTDPNNKALVTAGGVLQGGQDTAVKAQARLTKTITTDEVTALAAGLDVALGIVDMGALPTVLFCTRRPAGGAYGLITGMNFVFTLVAGTEYIVTVTDAVAILANTDVIEVVLEA